MKSVITLFVLAFLISNNQSDAQLVRSYGAKVALTSANQDFDYTIPVTVETIRRGGVNAAVFIEWLDVPFFSIVTQVEYSQRGMGMDIVVTLLGSPEGSGRRKVYDRVDYLSIPVLAKARAPLGTLSPYVAAGPRLDLLLGSKSDYGAFNSINRDFKDTHFGGTIVVGVESSGMLPIGVLVEARYNFDLTDAYKTEFLKIRNNSFDIWVGVAL